MISELTDVEILDFLMTSDFEENFSPDELKYLLLKWRYFYRILHGKNERMQEAYEFEFKVAGEKLDLEEKLYSQDLLRWKIIEWAKQNNCRYYDLSGVQISNRTPKEDGIFRNKEKWGGKLIIYPHFRS